MTGLSFKEQMRQFSHNRLIPINHQAMAEGNRIFAEIDATVHALCTEVDNYIQTNASSLFPPLEALIGAERTSQLESKAREITSSICVGRQIASEIKHYVFAHTWQTLEARAVEHLNSIS